VFDYSLCRGCVVVVEGSKGDEGNCEGSSIVRMLRGASRFIRKPPFPAKQVKVHPLSQFTNVAFGSCF
jgi:hypothetical protein